MRLTPAQGPATLLTATIAAASLVAAASLAPGTAHAAAPASDATQLRPWNSTVKIAAVDDGASIATVSARKKGRGFGLIGRGTAGQRSSAGETFQASASIRAAHPASVGKRAVLLLRQKSTSGAVVQKWRTQTVLRRSFRPVTVIGELEIGKGKLEAVVRHPGRRGAFQAQDLRVEPSAAKPALTHQFIDSFEAGAGNWIAQGARARTVRAGDAPIGRRAVRVEPRGRRVQSFSIRTGLAVGPAGGGRQRISSLVRAGSRASVGKRVMAVAVARDAAGRKVKMVRRRARLTAAFRLITLRLDVPAGGTTDVRIVHRGSKGRLAFLADAVRVVEAPGRVRRGSAPDVAKHQPVAAVATQSTHAAASDARTKMPLGPASWEERPYGRADWLYEGVGLTSVEPQSQTMVDALMGSTAARKPALTADGETPPVYEADAGDPLYTINTTLYAKDLDGLRIRLPVDANPGSGSDHPLIVLDPVTQTEARFWQASVDHQNRVVTASSGGLFDYGPNGDGRPFAGTGVGSGLSYLSGMIRPEEVQRGEIGHALRFAADFISSEYRFPATRSDQKSGGNNVVPMGTRFYLNVSPSECDARTVPSGGPNAAGATRFLRMICHAMREHGLYAADGAPLVVLTMENQQTANWGSVGVEEAFGNYGWIIRDDQTASDGYGSRRSSDGIPWERLVARADTGQGY